MDVVARSIDRLYRPVVEFLHSHPSPHRLQVQTVRNLLDRLRQKLHQPYEEIALAIAVTANADLEEYARAVVDAVKPIHMTLAFITTFDADEDVYYDGVPPTEVPVPPHYYRDQDGAPSFLLYKEPLEVDRHTRIKDTCSNSKLQKCKNFETNLIPP